MELLWLDLLPLGCARDVYHHADFQCHLGQNRMEAHFGHRIDLDRNNERLHYPRFIRVRRCGVELMADFPHWSPAYRRRRFMEPCPEKAEEDQKERSVFQIRK